MDKSLTFKSIQELGNHLRQKKISAVELTTFFLTQAQKNNKSTNAFITFNPEASLDQAKSADLKLHQNTATPLTGIPYGIKDAFSTSDFKTTCASQVLSNYFPPFDATVYHRLKQSGAVLLGKQNQDAWGHGGLSKNTDYSPVKNPWDQNRSAGGSSGGSAAALASGSCPFSIGEDTGGSIRNPATYSNVTGLKVTYGLVSRYGAIAYASSLDTVGPMALSVADLSLVLDQITGPDPMDASSAILKPTNYQKSLPNSLKGKNIGIIKEFNDDGLHPEVALALEKACHSYKSMGVNLREVSIPTLKYGVSIYYVIALSETSSNLARFDGVRFGQDRSHFSTETKRRIMTGTFALSSGYYDAYYKKALTARTKLIQEFSQAFSKVDVLIGPVMPNIAPKLTESSSPLEEYLADLYTCSINTTGLPSLAIPAGLSKSNLPIGIQLIGPMFSESLLLNVGHQFQLHTDFHLQHPN